MDVAALLVNYGNNSLPQMGYLVLDLGYWTPLPGCGAFAGYGKSSESVVTATESDLSEAVKGIGHSRFWQAAKPAFQAVEP